MIDGGGEGGVEPLEVSGVGDLVGIGDRVDAGRDRRLNLGQALAQTRRDRGAGFVEGALSRQTTVAHTTQVSDKIAGPQLAAARPGQLPT